MNRCFVFKGGGRGEGGKKQPQSVLASPPRVLEGASPGVVGDPSSGAGCSLLGPRPFPVRSACHLLLRAGS